VSHPLPDVGASAVVALRRVTPPVGLSPAVRVACLDAPAVTASSFRLKPEATSAATPQAGQNRAASGRLPPQRGHCTNEFYANAEAGPSVRAFGWQAAVRQRMIR
jgi:hypothetical protein